LYLSPTVKTPVKSQDLLLSWLERRLDPEAAAWLRAQCALLAEGAPDRVLHLAFGQAPRKTGQAGRQLLAADAREQAEAFAVHPGWDLREWTVDQAARAALLLALPSSEKSARETGASEKTVKAVLALFQTADLGEHVALVRALFLMPDAADLIHIAREGIRSNMGDVFRAVSQRNPYPAEHFDEIAWNQMVAKCVFTDLPLRSIHGLDRRANQALARMLLDLAQERRAAGRRLSPEAWRCIVPFFPTAAPEAEVLPFLERGLDRENAPADRRAVAVAAASLPARRGRALLEAHTPELVPALDAGTLTWENYDEHP
jgi:hypothetical protein